MPLIGSWSRRKLRRFRRSKAAQPYAPVEPPFLPESRPSCLTRPSSPLAPNSSLLSTSASPFFNNLPLEIRREIYIHAFGNRTTHMDLQYRIEDIQGFGHARIDYQSTQLAEEMPVFKSGGPLAWRWWGSVCHRALEGSKLHYDHCRLGVGLCNTKEKLQEECFIGVMSWLLTCRQAYAEAIDLLYSSNTIFIEAPFLMTNIHKLILPQRLASITSLELCWRSMVPSGAMSIQTVKSFIEIIGLLKPSTFTNLQQINLSFSDLYPFIQGLDGSIWETPPHYCPDYLLPYTDCLVASFQGQLKKCTIASPRTFYEDMKKQLLGEDDPMRPDNGPGEFFYPHFWRSLPGALGPTETLVGKGLGYWISQGVDDKPL